MRVEGFEPSTHELKARYSANWVNGAGGRDGGIRIHNVSYVSDFKSDASRQLRHTAMLSLYPIVISSEDNYVP